MPPSPDTPPHAIPTPRAKPRLDKSLLLFTPRKYNDAKREQGSSRAYLPCIYHLGPAQLFRLTMVDVLRLLADQNPPIVNFDDLRERNLVDLVEARVLAYTLAGGVVAFSSHGTHGLISLDVFAFVPGAKVLTLREAMQIED